MEKILSKLSRPVYSILDRTLETVLSAGNESALSIDEATTLLSCSNDSNVVAAVALTANALRKAAPCGNKITYVVNRNINFTNACVMRCGFCAFSRTGVDTEAYFLPLNEIIRRAEEAVKLGATEICVQAGLPPNMNPELYPNVARVIKEALPGTHLHAFSPEEVLYGSKRRKCSITDMVKILKESGVDSLPGTSAEILIDSVRNKIAKGRLSTSEWIEVITAAHSQKIPTTATMM
jgi:FO synthase subunit 2